MSETAVTEGAADGESTPPVLRLEAVRKAYNVGLPTEVEVLHGIDLTVARGDFAALVGPSGSGKSTLLNLIGLLDRPTSGEVWVQGQATRRLDDAGRTRLRGRSLGFVFQFHHLIPAFTALENVLMPLMVAQGKPRPQDVAWGRHLLDQVGLADRAHSRPDALSGGQQQRVAIARALAPRPALLLADEPTGNLDTRTAATVFALLRRFHHDEGCAVIIVTHDPRLSDQCDVVHTLIDGQLVSSSAALRSTSSPPT